MKLFEMRSRPKTAGKAELIFSNTNTPCREGNVITLRDYPELEFYPLGEGEQFLVRTKAVIPSRGLVERAIYFGGTDENPFLVVLKEEIFDRFMSGGEKAFYDALKPDLMKKLEKEFGVPAFRQGDIFAIQFPMSWDEVQLSARMFGQTKAVASEVKTWSILGTRHRLTGKMLEATIMGVQNTPIVEGVIECPDHMPMTLEGLHVLAQTAGLVEPKTAD